MNIDLLHLILIAADDANDVRGIELHRNIINFIANDLDEPLRNNLLQINVEYDQKIKIIMK